MKYYEITLNTPSSEIDQRCAELEAMGVSGFIIEDEADFHAFLKNNTQYWDYVEDALEEKYRGLSRIRFYLTEDDAGAASLKAILARYPSCTVSTVQDSDWENNWKENYKPLCIGQKLVIVPEWEPVPSDGRLPLILSPGLIFGTGSHPTTRMCLQALEKFASPGKKVLDLGCGSGILGIGALVLGCRECFGVDIDPKAPDIAAGNAALNGIGADKFHIYAGDVTADSRLMQHLGKDFDIVLANIVADVILALTPSVRPFMKPDAVFICSGIVDGREKEVRTALEANGFAILDHLHEEEWNAFVCTLQG